MTREESKALWELEKSSFAEKSFRTSFDSLYEKLMDVTDGLIQSDSITFEDYTSAIANNFQKACEDIKGDGKKVRRQILTQALQNTIDYFENYGTECEE